MPEPLVETGLRALVHVVEEVDLIVLRRAEDGSVVIDRRAARSYPSCPHRARRAPARHDERNIRRAARRGEGGLARGEHLDIAPRHEALVEEKRSSDG